MERSSSRWKTLGGLLGVFTSLGAMQRQQLLPCQPLVPSNSPSNNFKQKWENHKATKVEQLFELIPGSAVAGGFPQTTMHRGISGAS